MIDLETFGLNSKAPIITIGVVLFNAYLDNPNQVMPRQEFTLDIQDLMAKGFLPDASTIAFWLKQPDAARLHIANVIEDIESEELTAIARVGHNIHILAYELCGFLQDHCDELPDGKIDVRVWGNDALFDIGKLQMHFEAYDLAVPWAFWNVRCYRTIKAESNVPMTRVGTLHNACDDAESQARHLVRILME